MLPRANLVATGYQLEDLPRGSGAEEQIYQRQYRLELEMLLRPQFVQDRAMRELQMVDAHRARHRS